MPVVTMPPRQSNPAPVVPFPGPFPAAMPSSQPAAQRAAQPLPRRGTLEQGRALEALGHAIEYLVDSRLFLLDGGTLRSDDEAVQIMMRLSRAVFAECPEVISLRRRLHMWVVDRFAAASPELNHTR